MLDGSSAEEIRAQESRQQGMIQQNYSEIQAHGDSLEQEEPPVGPPTLAHPGPAPPVVSPHPPLPQTKRQQAEQKGD